MKITVQTTISADKKKVWDLYTNPKHIVNWNFASEDWCCPSAENDLQVGGKYKARMEAKDKSFGFDFEATYSEVVEGERFSSTLEDGREVNVSFENLDGQTKVVVVFDAEKENSEEKQRSGWQSILDNFRSYAEREKNG
ncbi:MAG: SRPBCC family protein [Candidatus Moraniibacteriota bacterium]|nr:MAG: SRPBCC family protein [Candidatus Moranbacteria bacterium]